MICTTPHPQLPRPPLQPPFHLCFFLSCLLCSSHTACFPSSTPGLSSPGLHRSLHLKHLPQPLTYFIWLLNAFQHCSTVPLLGRPFPGQPKLNNLASAFLFCTAHFIQSDMHLYCFPECLSPLLECSLKARALFCALRYKPGIYSRHQYIFTE